MPLRIVASVAISALISLLGYRARALTVRGACVATGVGTGIALGGRWPGIALLGTFFVSSSLLSRFARESEIAAKGSRRDAAQVLANGGVAAIAALGSLAGRPGLAYSAMAGSLAAANADTWATEIGSTSTALPRMLLSLRTVPRGTSGAVSGRGLASMVAGAALIGGVAALGRRETRLLPMAAVVAASGVVGALVDSVLGETLQERRRCPVCDVPTEARHHDCGRPTIRTGGVPWINNDVVNLTCTAVGGAGAALGWLWLSRSRGTPDRSRR